MASVAEEQIASLTPPRRGQVWAVTVDGTARAYDLSKIALGAGAIAPEKSGQKRQCVVLYLQAETADVYFYFDSLTGNSLADGTKQAAAAADVLMADAHCAVLKFGNPPIQVRIDRTIDKFIQVKSSGGVLRMWACSEPR